MSTHPKHWLEVRPEGLYCAPAGAYIDPTRPVDRAIITHGHSDHARSGHGAVLATAETLDIMAVRYGENFTASRQAAAYGEIIDCRDARITLFPAGHIIGSAQILIEHGGACAVVSGDYKRHADPTCAGFELVKCDVFITEATFGLPVFRHPPVETEVEKLLKSRAIFPDRCHLVGVYALGKCQRLIAELRRAGYDRPVYLHGALIRLCDAYEAMGIALGDIRPAAGVAKADLRGEIVLAPPSATSDRWSRRLPDPVPCAASGWMQIRARAKQRLVELPLVISDHADWDDLTRTMAETGASEIWVTHGREEALVHYAALHGMKARALSLLGYEEDEGE
ncbi:MULTISPECIES: ligase-associated DNA damage response exonuclease [Rhodomicrobium]|uniref:ligase-associated DNA damage response exonuclease n=1 Tax=Rhodomicrobium TaxID=1068 RepID=UPI000B4B417D|nr:MULTISPECIES: ligase-associated DNA damage response exonuclease [Rhodomicrobium]